MIRYLNPNQPDRSWHIICPKCHGRRVVPYEEFGLPKPKEYYSKCPLCLGIGDIPENNQNEWIYIENEKDLPDYVIYYEILMPRYMCDLIKHNSK
jgi:hypothetical protein